MYSNDMQAPGRYSAASLRGVMTKNIKTPLAESSRPRPSPRLKRIARASSRARRGSSAFGRARAEILIVGRNSDSFIGSINIHGGKRRRKSNTRGKALFLPASNGKIKIFRAINPAFVSRVMYALLNAAARDLLALNSKVLSLSAMRGPS